MDFEIFFGVDVAFWKRRGGRLEIFACLAAHVALNFARLQSSKLMEGEMLFPGVPLSSFQQRGLLFRRPLNNKVFVSLSTLLNRKRCVLLYSS